MWQGWGRGQGGGMYPAWFFLHYAVLAGSTGALLCALVFGRRAPGVALLGVVGALALVPVHVGVQLALASYGPDFALERVPLGVPLALLPLVAGYALPAYARAGRHHPAGPGRAAAVRVGFVGSVLAWQLALSPPTSGVAVVGTGLAYAVVLAAVVLAAAALVAPRRGRLVRVVAVGAVVVAGVGVLAGIAGADARLPAKGHAAHAGLAPGMTDLATLTGPAGPPDAAYTLTAQRTGDRWTYDGTVPGPELRVREGRLVQVTLLNRDVPAGVTLHWHGLDVPNAEDGVAGVTQDAVRPGGRHVYRFRPHQVGTFWYHSHQVSSEQVARGLVGVIVVEPRTGATGTDLALLDHGKLDATGPDRRDVTPGTRVRLRLVNATDTRQRYVLAGTAFRAVAIDGTALARPAEVRDVRVAVTAGGRADLEFRMPATPVALHGGQRRLELRPPGSAAALPDDGARGTLDPLTYGDPAPTPFGPGDRADREHRLVIDQRFAFGGRGLGYQWSMNGRVWPDGPEVLVRTGDLVRTTIVNRSTADHPMHLHGHHSLVVSRNGEPATGTPWWVDTLEVGPGETYEVLFRADNPGVWMDHCHNLPHARAGFVLHLRYEGVGTPFELGEETGNAPE